MVLKWPDRRPIGQLFISEAQFVTQNNPDGYLNKDVNTRTKEGMEAFRKLLLESAARWIEVIKDTGGQGMIVWDLEGYQQPSMVYVGDPRVLPEYSPAMNEVADEFFKQFLDAGLRTGVTIRPNKIFLIPPEGVAKWGKWGYLIYEEGKDDVVKEVSERIAYARKRWGCTLFYMDTNGYDRIVDGQKKHAVLPASMMKRLNELHPDVLIIPEHPNHGYHAYVAQYRELRGGWTGTPAEERRKYHGAFSVLSTGGLMPGDLEDRWEGVADSVMRGDVLFTFGWYPSSMNTSSRHIYQQAEYMKRDLPAGADGKADALLSLLKDKDPALRFVAARALGLSGGEAAVGPLIDSLRNDGDWVVRKEAAVALGRLKAAAAAGPLADAVKSDGGSLRFLAAQALAAIGQPAAAPLAGLADSDDRELRLAAAYGLGRLDDPAAVPPLLKLLDDKTADVRQEAVEAVGRRKDPRAVEPLVKLLETDKGWPMQLAIIGALGQIADPRAAEPVRRFLTVQAEPGWVQQRLRSAAQRALQSIENR